MHHPIVGELELSYETLTLDADDGLRLALYTTEAGSASQQALDLLSSWTATPEPDRESMTSATAPALTLNNGVTIPPWTGCLPEPARGDHRRRGDGAA